MTPHEAKKIIECLALGVDPETGEVLTEESTLNSPQVIRALVVALTALNSAVKRSEHNAPHADKAGQPWSTAEEEELLASFDAGTSIKEIAKAHGRSRGGITSRLVRLGRIKTRANAEDPVVPSPLKKLADQSHNKDQVNSQSARKYDAQHNSEECLGQTAGRPDDESFEAFNALERRTQEIVSFLVQMGKIPKPNQLWIFGDGKSWGQMIEHTDAIKNHRDTIERIAKIFCDWVYECSAVMHEPGWKELARQFELRLTASPEDALQLFKIIQRQSDAEISKSIHYFMK